MDDPVLVRRLERVGDLRGNGQRLGERDRPSRHPLGERLALHELHHERRSALDLLDAVDGGDVRDG